MCCAGRGDAAGPGRADKVPAKTIAEFVSYLKANTGKVAYGSSGIGSSLHLGMELFLQRTGTTAIHVPYKGSAPMLTDLLSGQVVASMDTAATSWPHVQSGKLRALGVSTARRAFFAPDLTPIADTLPGFDVKPSWQGVMASSGAPQPTVDRLAQEIQAFIAQPAIQAKLRDRGMVPAGSSARIRSGEERRIRAQQEGGEGRRHHAGVRLRVRCTLGLVRCRSPVGHLAGNPLLTPDDRRPPGPQVI